MTYLLDSIQNSFKITQLALANFSCPQNLEKIAEIGDAMAELLKKGNKLMSCGNGGSACQAMHFAEELSGRYRLDRRALAALPLTDASHMTCVGNDYGFDKIFSRAVEAYGRVGDGLLILSTSGNSANLIAAVESAQLAGIQTYALLGKGGGKLKGVCEHEVIVPGLDSDVVQNLHTMIIHTLIESIERVIFPENYKNTCHTESESRL